MKNDIKISVLMSVYYRENPLFLERALLSLWDEQTRKPDEIVLVKDGPLTPELDEVIESWQKKIDKSLVLVILERNMGLGIALNEGLAKCSYEWVARMDSDDISLPSRFESVANFISTNPQVEIFGAHISEFEVDESNIYATRKVPIASDIISKTMKVRCPLNHVTVVFRRDVVLQNNGYVHFNGMEDYYLWVRLFLRDVKFGNLDEVTVNVRAGQEMTARRGGWGYAKSELEIQKLLYREKQNNLLTFGANSCARVVFRMMPVSARRLLYKFVLRKGAK